MYISKQNGPGGARAGAGRPKLESSKLREAIIRKAEENAGPLADALYDKAITGDVPAIREFFDRALGRPQASVDVTSGGKELPQPILTGILTQPATTEDKPDQP